MIVNDGSMTRARGQGVPPCGFTLVMAPLAKEAMLKSTPVLSEAVSCLFACGGLSKSSSDLYRCRGEQERKKGGKER